MYSKEYKDIRHTKNLFGPLHISSTNFCPVNSNIPLSISSPYSFIHQPRVVTVSKSFIFYSCLCTDKNTAVCRPDFLLIKILKLNLNCHVFLNNLQVWLFFFIL